MSEAPLIERIARAPVPFDADAAARAREEIEGLAPPAAELWAPGASTGPLLDGVFGCSPYLRRLARREANALAALCARAPETAIAELIADVSALADDEATSVDALVAGVRLAKRRAHLTAALADVGGAWSLAKTTRALTELADASVQTALSVLWRRSLGAPRGPSADAPAGSPPGLFVLALGKMGAFELNYSSDIDIIVFFEPEALLEVGVREPQTYAVRLVQSLTRALQEHTADGYGFRVDLRLRPDPGATAVAVSTSAALRYYEALGQTWERAALIKARACAGDMPAAETFLAEIEPFVWRRSLDFAALEDLHVMKRRMHATGAGAPLRAAGADLKRDRGGIRDIEFLAQAQQLIFGGRETAVRVRPTLEALARLTELGQIGADDVVELIADYELLRTIEHRLQMIDDQQTHTVPAAPEERRRVAALHGTDDLARFDAMIERTRTRVHARYNGLFAELGRDAPLDDPGMRWDGGEAATFEKLAEMGFAEPEAVVKTVQRWTEGRVRATASERARSRIAPFADELARAAAATGAPDLAFSRFAQFFERLPAGVQLLSMFRAEPALLRGVVEILALAPRLAPILARQPSALDVMLDQQFAAPLAEGRAEFGEMRRAIEGADTFEEALNAARRGGREQFFRVGAHVLLGLSDAAAAGAAFADLAEALIDTLARAAVAEVARRAGEIDAEFVVLGLGKLGGREMSAASDLDLMVVYRPASDDAMSSGPERVTADAYFARVTQRLIAALSAPTEEGDLYAVDMQLRPSGSAGPIAVRFSAFERYYETDAWTWELMALTRARVVCGAPGLARDVEAQRRHVLARPRDVAALARDVADMRTRIAGEKPASGRWDLKLAPGGLVDIEFAAQFIQLAGAAGHPELLDPSTIGALEQARTCGALNEADAAALLRAAHLQLDLTQLLKIAFDDGADLNRAPERFKELLARAAQLPDIASLESELAAVQAAAQAAFERIVIARRA